MHKTQNTLCKSPITSLGYDLYSVLDNQKALKTVSRPLHSKLKKFQRLFKDLHRNLRAFKEKWNSRTPLKFKDFSRLCKPCIVSVQFITNHCSDMLSAKIVWKRSPLDLFIATNDSGLPQSRSTSAVFYVYFLGFSSFIPEKKFKMQRIAFFSMQVSLHGIFSAINTSVNIFANFQIGYGNDTFERSSVFAVETLA